MADAVPRNETARHTAIVEINVDIHECLPTGECSGRLAEPRKVVRLLVEGADKFICTRKVNEMLEEVKKWSRPA